MSPAPLPTLLVLDACVLMSSILRPLLLQLAQAGLFEPVWSATLGHEWRRNAARVWGVPAEALDTEWAALQARFPSADIGATDPYKAGLRYSDPKDWHVIAAARAAQARDPAQQVGILTWNTRDFNRSELRRLGLSCHDPDRLLAAYWRLGSPALRAALPDCMSQARALPRVPDSLDTLLKRERLFQLAGLARLASATLPTPLPADVAHSAP